VKKRTVITSLLEAIDFFRGMLENHPERNGDTADGAVIDGVRRKYPVINLNCQPRPDDKDKPSYEFDLPEVSMPQTEEGDLAREIINMLSPLQMLNPVRACFSVGSVGPGDLVPSF